MATSSERESNGWREALGQAERAGRLLKQRDFAIRMALAGWASAIALWWGCQ